MSNASAINAILLERFKREQAEVRQQIELLSSGKMTTHQKTGNVPLEDTTPSSLNAIEPTLPKLDILIAQLEG
jgi:hypothetical protein